MWFAATLLDNKADENGKINELRVMFNTEIIRMLVENKDNPETTMVSFLDGTKKALIKGSYESNAKIFYGLNRK